MKCRPVRLAPATLALLAASLVAPAAAATSPVPPEAVVVRSSGGSKTIQVIEKGNAIEVVLPNGDRLLGEPKGDKRKYRRLPSGPQLLEVKAGDEGFKLRTPDGKLLWKVKIADDKIKVSDNEENANPFSIKTKYPDKAKVVDAAEKELAEVRFGADKTKVKGPDGAELWETTSPRRRSASFGVLVLPGIPEEHRAVLMAEILARRR